MSVSNTSELIEIKKEVLKIEGEITKILNNLPRNKSVSAGRCKDYGERQIVIQMPLDEFNIEVFSDENVKAIRNLHERFQQARAKQKQLEERYDTDSYPSSMLKQDLSAKLRY